MFKFITPPDAAIFCGIAGLVMILTGREIAGAIVLSSALGGFIFFEWFLYHRKPEDERLHEREAAVTARENELNDFLKSLSSERDY